MSLIVANVQPHSLSVAAGPLQISCESCFSIQLVQLLPPFISLRPVQAHVQQYASSAQQQTVP